MVPTKTIVYYIDNYGSVIEYTPENWGNIWRQKLEYLGRCLFDPDTTAVNCEGNSFKGKFTIYDKRGEVSNQGEWRTESEVIPSECDHKFIGTENCIHCGKSLFNILGEE